MPSKRYNALPKETKKLKQDKIENLIQLVKKNCTTKFNESIDVNFQLNLKQKKTEVNIRTIVNLPAGTGKKIKVAVICEEEKNDSHFIAATIRKVYFAKDPTTI